MRYRTFSSRMLALVALASMLLPGVASAGHQSPEDCFKDRTATFARFVDPSDGTLSVQTGVGSISYQAGSPIPNVVISTTGSVNVTFEYACLIYIQLDAFKQNADGSWSHFYSNGWDLDCEHDTKTDSVPIGLDGGEYRFSLSGEACNGQPLRPTDEGGLVGDPPIL